MRYSKNFPSSTNRDECMIPVARPPTNNAPPGISGYQTIKGRTLVVDADGVVALTESEAEALKGAAGWSRISDVTSETTGG